jgi:hypothetical protein
VPYTAAACAGDCRADFCGALMDDQDVNSAAPVCTIIAGERNELVAKVPKYISIILSVEHHPKSLGEEK